MGGWPVEKRSHGQELIKEHLSIRVDHHDKNYTLPTVSVSRLTESNLHDGRRATLDCENTTTSHHQTTEATGMLMMFTVLVP